MAVSSFHHKVGGPPSACIAASWSSALQLLNMRLEAEGGTGRGLLGLECLLQQTPNVPKGIVCTVHPLNPLNWGARVPKGMLSYCTWAQDAARTKAQEDVWLVSGLKNHRDLPVTRVRHSDASGQATNMQSAPPPSPKKKQADIMPWAQQGLCLGAAGGPHNIRPIACQCAHCPIPSNPQNIRCPWPFALWASEHCHGSWSWGLGVGSGGPMGLFGASSAEEGGALDDPPPSHHVPTRAPGEFPRQTIESSRAFAGSGLMLLSGGDR